MTSLKKHLIDGSVGSRTLRAVDKAVVVVVLVELVGHAVTVLVAWVAEQRTLRDLVGGGLVVDEVVVEYDAKRLRTLPGDAGEREAHALALRHRRQQRVGVLLARTPATKLISCLLSVWRAPRAHVQILVRVRIEKTAQGRRRADQDVWDPVVVVVFVLQH